MVEKSSRTGKDLKSFVYNDLKEKIVECVYPPGTHLNELELTEAYKVSRTPVREAVARLEMRGFLKVLPKKGIYVTDLSVENVLQIFEARIRIEPVCLKMAFPYLDIVKLIDYRSRFLSQDDDSPDAFRLDMEMHLYLIDMCRNDYLTGMMHDLYEDNTRVVIATGQNRAKVHDAKEEHIVLLESLIRHTDVDASCRLLEAHLNTCRMSALAFFNHGESFKRT